MRRLGGLVSVVSIALAACQSGAATPTAAPTTAATQVTTAAAATPAVTPVPTLPVTVPRPSDLPTDGSCEDQDSSCLGVLQPKTSYSSKIFEPRVTFQVPNAGWFNQFDGHGELPLFSHDPAGDTVIFLREPRAPDESIGASIDEIAAWLATFDQVSVTRSKAVKLGGLNGVTMDVTVAPGATAWDPQCPVRVCVPYLHGRDPVVGDPYPWDWDWGVAGTEKERLYLLDASDGTIAVVVDSLDGTTFDSLVGIWEQIVPTIKFG